jgi:hypothetical protein
LNLVDIIQQLKPYGDLLKGNLMGLEKEGLRVSRKGGISQASHPKALGCALTNTNITTDISESLIEVLTLPIHSFNWPAHVDKQFSSFLDCLCHIEQLECKSPPESRTAYLLSKKFDLLVHDDTCLTKRGHFSSVSPKSTRLCIDASEYHHRFFRITD